MKVRLLKLGRSLVVRLPAAALKKAGFRERDLLEVDSDGEGHLELRGPKYVPTLARLAGQITPENRYEEISTGKRVGRERIE